jgi:hypothetical protein
MAHDFRECLDYSYQCSDEPFWEQVYRQAFHNFKGQIPVYGRCESQWRGVDRLVYLSNDTVLRVDEKKRKKVREDILLEYLSNDQKRTPGWIELDLAIDYLAVAFMPIQKVYLLPWVLLRRAWLKHGEEWIQWGDERQNGFETVSAENPGYRTWSVAVPIKRLYAAIHRSSVIEVKLPNSAGSA